MTMHPGYRHFTNVASTQLVDGNWLILNKMYRTLSEE